MPETTHVGRIQRGQGPERYASEQADQDSAADAWIAAAVGATTLGELEDVVAGAKAGGAATDEFLAWCRALWTALGSGGHWAAIALVRRELGGELIDGGAV